MSEFVPVLTGRSSMVKSDVYMKQKEEITL